MLSIKLISAPNHAISKMSVYNAGIRRRQDIFPSQKYVCLLIWIYAPFSIRTDLAGLGSPSGSIERENCNERDSIGGILDCSSGSLT